MMFASMFEENLEHPQPKNLLLNPSMKNCPFFAESMVSKASVRK